MILVGTDKGKEAQEGCGEGVGALLDDGRRGIPKLTALQKRELRAENPGQHPVTIPETARANQSLKNKINLEEKYPAHQPLSQ